MAANVQSSSLWSKWYSCLIPTTFIGVGLFLIAGIIVLSLIPAFIPTKTLSAGDSYSSLINLKYNIPRTLVGDLSENTMVLHSGNLTDNRVKLFEAVLQNKLYSNQNFKNLRINISQVSTQSLASSRRRRTINRRSSNGERVIIYQKSDNSTEFDQLEIFFRLVRHEPLTKSIISSALINIFNQIEFNATTFLTLFGDDSTSGLSTRAISYHVKDSGIMTFDDVNVFGIKHYTGNIQNIYAIQTNNTIYTIDNGKIVRIRSLNETFVFNYDDVNNHTYQTPNITFPTPIFIFPQNESVPNIFTGILVKLNNQISSSSVDDGTLLLNYLDANQINKSAVMLTMGGGRYYVPLPTNDSLFDKYYDSNKFLTTITQQSDAYLQLFQTYPIVDICSKVPDVGKSFCSFIVQEMTVTIPGVLRTASQNISEFQTKSQLFGQMTNFTVIALVPGEESLIIPLNTNNLISSKSNTRVVRNVNDIDITQLNTFSIQIIGARGQCNEETVAGNDIPDDRIIEIGKSHTTVTFSYETYVIKDQIEVYYMNQQIFSTGCVGANGAINLTLDGDESTLRVNVIPDCAGDTGTAWYYSLQCTNELICEDDICYCGLTRKNSTQIQPATYNGCGGEGSPFNFLINPLGDMWGFTPACNDHDMCYGTCNNLRNTCDTNFLTSMQQTCSKFSSLPDGYNNCEGWAGIFYLAVHFEGTHFFVPGQKDDCNCVTK
ncbi:unnamed protein product [Adineta steineri]|uniref:Uncharacterized protein n=1 Tax=Adineta steineri TaxID=433720 RepID=A0A816EAC7_9BILA|nr:unnamed protein product [Adineta steineri]CAF1643481.1 unnamed protein product [Adineta steineri]